MQFVFNVNPEKDQGLSGCLLSLLLLFAFRLCLSTLSLSTAALLSMWLLRLIVLIHGLIIIVIFLLLVTEIEANLSRNRVCNYFCYTTHSSSSSSSSSSSGRMPA